MVCFIDDDIVCENYSVSEEIYLLNGNIDPDIEYEVDRYCISGLYEDNKICVVDDGCERYIVGFACECTGNAHIASYCIYYTTSKLMQLPCQAGGSRFENPKWWTYLPSLKPIGLTALLNTQMPMIRNSSYKESHNDETKSSKKVSLDTMALGEWYIPYHTRLSIEGELVKHVRATPPIECLKYDAI